MSTDKIYFLKGEKFSFPKKELLCTINSIKEYQKSIPTMNWMQEKKDDVNNLLEQLKSAGTDGDVCIMGTTPFYERMDATVTKISPSEFDQFFSDSIKVSEALSALKKRNALNSVNLNFNSIKRFNALVDEIKSRTVLVERYNFANKISSSTSYALYSACETNGQMIEGFVNASGRLVELENAKLFSSESAAERSYNNSYMMNFSEVQIVEVQIQLSRLGKVLEMSTRKSSDVRNGSLDDSFVQLQKERMLKAINEASNEDIIRRYREMFPESEPKSIKRKM